MMHHEISQAFFSNVCIVEKAVIASRDLDEKVVRRQHCYSLDDVDDR